MFKLSRRAQRSSAEPSRAAATDQRPEKWSLGILNDKETDEVPGSVLLLSKVNQYNAPLGLEQTPARTSSSSLPMATPPLSARSSIFSHLRTPRTPEKKKTADGKFILEPQPTDSANDPLNWPVLRRDLALISLGLYCMLGGGMTPVLAAGFSQVATDLNVTVPQVALTTGLYMMGLGLGSVVLSPTAILYGKRPVYLAAAMCFVLANVWCALSPNFASLVVARIFMGFAVSSVECLPSASIAEIYFLHEKAYRLGIYTLLLLGGKNLVPLISAIIIQSLGWRWVFWIIAIIVGFAGILLFFFVPETFWDRSPIPRSRRKPSNPHHKLVKGMEKLQGEPLQLPPVAFDSSTIAKRRAAKHAHFRNQSVNEQEDVNEKQNSIGEQQNEKEKQNSVSESTTSSDVKAASLTAEGEQPAMAEDTMSGIERQQTQDAVESTNTGDYIRPAGTETVPNSAHDLESGHSTPQGNPYTKAMAVADPKSFVQQLKPYSGRLTHDNWFKVAMRPFILFAYPSILWSALVYALSIGWLIVLSESVAVIYENRESYNFTALQVGLVYISPFVGGVLGTAVAGKVSDVLVQWLARKNGGVYEPEFRLIMAIPIAITTVIGLMGYGWSVAERDAWIVPTIFFGIISFGCSLGSTTSITFAVDSYRQYAGEALVTLNFSKNILHGLVWSLFFNTWLQDDGSKTVFIAIGAIQLACLLTTIPMYIYGKRGRMWTVRKNLMEKF
ncbi:hypothetical protein AMS68_003887 [Peltaster fructicola]|uniref:Major facilitator superfamily (MFS) profile domain-containing protein n=1 Tax=Peltaster fructicola TaxID=286661 RepID=A0A6H0XV97_9PEZI|nr:hypothetical protein AMS68_003887 [Peltaster fructicola]